MGLLYLATVARQRGHDVRIVDLQANPDATAWSKTLRDLDPVAIGISTTSPSHKAGLALARAVKELRPDAMVIKGGVHETYCARHTLRHCQDVDYCMAGEADWAFSDLVDAIQGSSAIHSVRGVVFRSGDGITRTAPIPSLTSLDALPIPDRSLLGNSAYYNFRIFGYQPTAQVQTMRGCPFQCSFCNQRNRKPVYRSIDLVVQELADLRAGGYVAVFFDDATFTVNRRRTIALMESILDAKVRLEFGGQTRAGLVDGHLLETMAMAGFSYLSFGLETTDENALRSLMKAASAKNFIDATTLAVHECRQSGIRSCVNLIVGLPNENDESLKRTFDFANRLDPDYVSLSALATYPHEDPALADVYYRGLSEEPIWESFDEGFGAYHPHLDAERAAEVLALAHELMGDKLEVV